jgi:DNA polymerase-1
MKTVFLNMDLSQAEHRVVALLSGDETFMQEAFRPLEGGIDTHKETAALIFEVPYDQVNAEQRYVAKKVVHGSERLMGARKLASTMRKDGYNIKEHQAQRYLIQLLKKKPGLMMYIRRVKRAIHETRTLTNPFGRRIYFEWDRLDDALYRKAMSFLPQSTVADIVNVLFWKRLYKWFAENGYGRVNQQGHDSLLMSVQIVRVYETMQYIAEELAPAQAKIKYRLPDTGEYLPPMIIPVEFSVGCNWGALTLKYTALPTKKQCTQDLRALLQAARGAGGKAHSFGGK